ncbi:MAG: hypothetical protein ACE5GH_04470 [Fidelibacterota bacterium]
MKITGVLALLASAALLGQGTPESTAEAFSFDVSDIKQLDLDISYSFGRLTVKPNLQTRKIDGVFQYNPRLTRPDIDYHTLGSKGKLKIAAGSLKHENHDSGWSFNGDWKELHNREYDNKLEVRLPKQVPLDVRMELGLGEALLDLSNLTVSGMKLDAGFSSVTISMSTPNPVSCRKVTFETGLGDFSATGLGNLRAKTFRLKVGLGSADVDLSGERVEDMKGEIEVGLGSLDLILPKDTNIRLSIDRSFLSSVDVDDLEHRGDEWISPRWEHERPTFELEISVGLGSVDVQVE